MQTLSEFRKHWQPIMAEQMKIVSDKIEAGGNMYRFLAIEPQLRSAVDGLVREYSEGLSVEQESLTMELGYLLHLRLQEACLFAQFLDFGGLGSQEKTAQEWIEFLAIDSWHELLMYKWAHDFERCYRKR